MKKVYAIFIFTGILVFAIAGLAPRVFADTEIGAYITCSSGNIADVYVPSWSSLTSSFNSYGGPTFESATGGYGYQHIKNGHFVTMNGGLTYGTNYGGAFPLSYVNAFDGASSFANSDWYVRFNSQYIHIGNIYSGICPTTSTTTLDISTHIISIFPENGTTTSNTVTFEMQAYINPDDLAGISGISINFKNNDNNVFVFSELSPFSYDFLEYYNIENGGYFTYSTTTYLGDGNYTVTGEILGTTLTYIVNPLEGFLGVIDRVSNEFIVNEATFIGNLQSTIGAGLNALSGGRSATSTESLVNSCIPWASSFDTFNCISFLFVPNKMQIQSALVSLKENVLVNFPLGYVTDFISILSTTTTSSIKLIDTTIPTGILGSGTSIVLDLTNVLDPLFNATSSKIGSSTKTFYELTSYYWDLLVYIAFAIYIISRILGSHLIPKLFHKL